MSLFYRIIFRRPTCDEDLEEWYGECDEIADKFIESLPTNADVFAREWEEDGDDQWWVEFTVDNNDHDLVALAKKANLELVKVPM
jgi:hypothetical protein